MSTRLVFDSATIGALSEDILVTHEELPVTLAIEGATTETCYIQMKVNGNYVDVYDGGSLIVLDADHTNQVMRGPGVYRLKLVAPVNPITVIYQDKHISSTVTTMGSTNYAWTPSDLTTIGWYDPSDSSTITESGGAVSQLDDKSGNSNDVIQATGAKQPVTGTRTLNGLNVLDCDGGDFLWNSSFAIGANNVAVYAVGEIDVIDDNNDAVFSMDRIAAEGGDFQLEASNFDQVNFYGRLNGTDVANINPYADAKHGPSIYEVVWDYDTTAEVNVYIDGIVNPDGPKTPSSAMASPVKFYIFTNRAASQEPDGAFGEVVVTTDVSDATRQLVEGYLAWKWSGAL